MEIESVEELQSLAEHIKRFIESSSELEKTFRRIS